MAGKHTAGPWETFFNGGGHIGVKTGYCTITWVAGEHLPTDQQEANARLIAAAPDLLEALQNMLGAFDTPARRLKFPYSFGDEAIETALAAIARATQPLPPQSEEV